MTSSIYMNMYMYTANAYSLPYNRYASVYVVPSITSVSITNVCVNS